MDLEHIEPAMQQDERPTYRLMIADMALEERPRGRLINYGVSGLSEKIKSVASSRTLPNLNVAQAKRFLVPPEVDVSVPLT